MRNIARLHLNDSKKGITAAIDGLLITVMLLLAACVPSGETAVTVQPTHLPLDPTYAAQIAALRDPNIPDLPFPDNPDPSLCGIPTQWGDDGAAWLNGIYAGELVQDPVLLYESHLRLQIQGRAAHGAPVKVILYQQNPETDYYFVKVEGWAGTQRRMGPGAIYLI